MMVTKEFADHMNKTNQFVLDLHDKIIASDKIVAGLSHAHDMYRLATNGAVPERIILSPTQFDLYINELKEFAKLMGLDTSHEPEVWRFRGADIEVKK